MFGKWISVFKRNRDWTRADVFVRMSQAVSDGPDLESAMVDATIVKVHRHGWSANAWPAPSATSAPTTRLRTPKPLEPMEAVNNGAVRINMQRQITPAITRTRHR